MNKLYAKYNDAELFTKLKGSKQEAEAAFGEIYSRYSQRVYVYCLRIIGSPEEARDIYQETFLKFYRQSQSENHIENVPGYILRIARNLCLNFKRDLKTTVNIEDYHQTSHDPLYERKELLNLISSSLELLDFDYREAFVLREYHGYSYQEIADITGDTVPAIKNRVLRAKDKIRSILAPYLEDLAKL